MRLVLCLLLLFHHVQAQADTPYLVGVQDIRYFPHYDFRAQDKGLIWAILEAFTARAGYRFDYVAYPIKRLNRELMDGQLDFVFPENPKWYNQRVPENIKTYSDAVYKAAGGTFILRHRQHMTVKDIRTLVIPRGFSPVMWRDQIDGGVTTLIEVSDSHASLNLLLKGRADAADLEYAVVNYLQQQDPTYEEITFAPHLPYDIVDFHLATVAHKDIMKEFNRFLHEERAHILSLLKQYNMMVAPQVELLHGVHGNH